MNNHNTRLEHLPCCDEVFRSMIENSRDGICITQDGMFRYVNTAFCELVGYTSLELYKMSGEDLLAEKNKERMMQQHFRRMAGDDCPLVDIATLLHKNGTPVDIEMSASIMDYNGETASYISVRDITQRLKIQSDLECSEQKYRNLVENASDGIIITQNSVFKFVNKAFCNMVEYTEEELIGMGFLDVVSDDDVERLKEYHALRMAGSKHQMIYEAKGVSKSGKIIYFEINTSYIDYNGQPATFIIIRDHTGHKQLEDTLRKSEERYRKLIQSLQEGLFVLQDDKFIFVNGAIVDILGYTIEEITGKSFEEVIPPERREQVLLLNQERKDGVTGSRSYELTLLHKDKVTRVPVILSTNITEFDGKMAIVGTAKDISDRIRTEEEIKNAHNRLEEINHRLEQTIEARTRELTEVNTQLLKVQKENLQSQFDMLKQQVNPHFLFNSLNVLTSLIRIEPELAEKFTEHLSKVYRYVLENKDNELVKLSTELDFLNAYLFLLNIRFMGKLIVNINIPEEMRNYLVIPLAMQLLIENAIKHNSMSKKSPLIIDLFVDKKLFLNVVNNLQVRESHLVSTGVGLQNIQNRYLLLNNSSPEFERTAEEFIARIPLIKENLNK